MSLLANHHETSDFAPWAAAVAVGLIDGARPDFESSKPLFEFRDGTFAPQANEFAYSASADGQRFLISTLTSNARPTLEVLENWTPSQKK